MPNLGFFDGTAWLRFTIENDEDTPLQLFLQSGQGVLDHVILYELSTEGYLEKLGGKRFEWDKLDYPSNFPTFSLNLPPGEKKSYVISQKSFHNSNLSFTLFKSDPFIKNTKEVNLYLGLYMGVVLIMILYNFVIFTFTRDSTFIYYIASMIFLHLLTYLSLFGLDHEYLFQGNTWWARRSVQIFQGCSVISTALFVMHFLHCYEKWPRIRLQLLAIMGIGCVCLMTGLFTLNISVNVFIPLTVSACIGWLITLVAYLAYKRERAAIFFIVAWMPLLVLSSIHIFESVGLIPISKMTLYSLLFAAGFECVTLAIALADRINIMRNEQHQLLSNFNKNLEDEIKVRTQTIAKQQLSLASAQTLASIGTMAGGMAHEMNNPLTIIKMCSETIAQKLNGPFLPKDQILNYNNKIIDAVGRIADIVGSLQTLSKNTDRSESIESLEKTIGLALLVTRQQQAESFVKVMVLCQEGITINCNKSKIVIAFSNLIKNAIEAASAESEKWVKIGAQMYDNETVEIMFTDSGKGIDKEILDKIFLPFFTTKDVNQGKGLGLSLAERIFKAHSGSILYDRSMVPPCFVVRLPANLSVKQKKSA